MSRKPHHRLLTWLCAARDARTRSRPGRVGLRLAGVLAASVAALALHPLAAADAVAKQVAEVFQPYAFEVAALSRDGRRLAFLLERGLGLGVVVVDVDRWTRAEFTIDEPAAAGVEAFEWLQPDLLLVVTRTPAIVAVDLRLGAARKVLDAAAFTAVTAAGEEVPRRPRFLGTVPEEPGSIYVEGASPARAGEPDLTPAEARLQVFEVVKLDLRTGARAALQHVLADRGARVLHDRQGQPRLLHERARVPQVFRVVPQGAAALLPRMQELDRVAGAPALRFEVTPQNFRGERSFPLCFGGDPDVLYYASNIGRDTHGIFALNLRTRERVTVALAEDGFDLADPEDAGSAGPLVFDRATGRLAGVRAAALRRRTRWIDEELAAVQRTVDAKFPGRDVDVVGWDDARTRFLLQVSTLTDPGRMFVYHRADGRCVEFARRARWHRPEAVHAVETFDFKTTEGVRLAGRVTVPGAPRLAVPPLVVWCHDGPAARWPLEFDRGAQALAAMGCLVLQVEYRGSAGLGRRHAELPPDAVDRMPIADTLTAMNWIALRHRFDRQRVAIMGEGFGGYLALRAVALQPDVFRCAISMNAPMELAQLHDRPAVREQDMRQFMAGMRAMAGAPAPGAAGEDADGGGTDVAQAARPRMTLLPDAPAIVDFESELARWMFSRGGAGPSVLKEAARIRQPVFLIHDRTHRTLPIGRVRELRQVLRRQGVDVEFLEVAAPFTQGRLAARAPVFQQIHAFLNAALYDYGVKIGRPQVIDEERK